MHLSGGGFNRRHSLLIRAKMPESFLGGSTQNTATFRVRPSLGNAAATRVPECGGNVKVMLLGSFFGAIQLVHPLAV
jgi:hypothetical protein